MSRRCVLVLPPEAVMYCNGTACWIARSSLVWCARMPHQTKTNNHQTHTHTLSLSLCKPMSIQELVHERREGDTPDYLRSI
jgi:hypothetical protein